MENGAEVAASRELEDALGTSPKGARNYRKGQISSMNTTHQTAYTWSYRAG